MNELESTFARLWESACQDKAARPSVVVKDGRFCLTITGNRPRWNELCRAAGVPEYATQTMDGDVLTATWVSWADAIFGADGLIAQRLPTYEVRLPQLHMARLVQRSIEMGQPFVAEGGTGVGKSYAYAAIAMAMGKKVVISTSNKALQMQLYRKDIPFLQSIFPGKKVALAVGKSNFACRFNAEAKGFKTKELQEWYATTETGNTEEIDFAVDWKELAAITVDDDCGGKHCPHYYECFYYEAKAARQDADVIITNHALLCLHQLYAGAGILPNYDLLVVDEAHKLPDYARNALGVEVRLPSITKTIEAAQPFVDDLETFNEAMMLAAMLERQVADFLRGQIDPRTGKTAPQVGMNQTELGMGQSLGATLLELADEVWSEAELPNDGDERKRARRAQRIRSLADKVTVMAEPGELVRWIESAEPVTLKAAPADVARFIGQMAGVTEVTTPQAMTRYTHCTRCHRELTAAKVAILDGRPYGPECIKHVDTLGDAETVDLAEWLAMDHAPVTEVTRTGGGLPVVYCSATLAAPDLSAFMREAGLPDALQMVASSPFNYQDNAMIYLPNGASPAPNSPTWREWAVDEMDELVRASGGGAFLLFTSIDMMRHAAQALRARWLNRWQTMVQGELPKLEIAKRFAADGNAVLFATKSFFEGVSIDGQALRLVVVDKMPFEAPNPLSTAMEANLLEWARTHGYSGNKLEMYPFTNLRVPRMIIDLKQASGRLIRTATDTGVIAILDPRIRSSQYGRGQVIPALPPAPVLSSRQVAESFLRKARRPVTEVTEKDRGMAKVVTGGRAKASLAEALPVKKVVTMEADGDVLWA